MAQALNQAALDEWTKAQPKRNGVTKVTSQKPSTAIGHLVTKNKIVPTAIKVGVWDLQTNELNESLFNGRADESVIGADGRKKVSKKHLMPGGKYRGT
jgi:hypothetical protein